jgi:hypothetical protein
MENKKWLYFRSVTDAADDHGLDASLCVPANSLISMSPSSDTALTMTFSGVRNNGDHADAQSVDTVILTVTEGDMYEVMEAISQVINSNPFSDGFIVIADDCITTDSADSTLADLTIASKYAHPSLTACASINAATASQGKAITLPSMTFGGPSTVISNGLALAVNTNYHSIATAAAMTIPSAADGKAGDWITVRYSTVVNDGATHTYTTTTDATFVAGSAVTRVGGGVASGIDVSDGSAKNILTIDGDTNGDGGIGTTVKFINISGGTDGWAVEAVVLNQGDGSVAMAGATAFS